MPFDLFHILCCSLFSKWITLVREVRKNKVLILNLDCGIGMWSEPGGMNTF